MHDPPRERAANDAFRKPRGFNQPVKVNAGFNAHLMAEKYHIFRANISRPARITMTGKGATAQPGH
jgi:hypothetical protein